jgi:phytoene desaturase (3,4-didehydrolycopene-forming)
VGLSPYNAPGVFSLLAATELIDGVWYPVGGFGKVGEALAQVAQKAGAEIHTNVTVASIDHKAGKASGVTLEDGTFMGADIVVANADLPYAYNNLIHGTGTSSNRWSKKLLQYNYSAGVIAYNWALDKRLKVLRHHNVFLSGFYQESWNRATDPSSLLEQPNFYVHVPAHTDQSAAPAGESLGLSAWWRFCHNYSNHTSLITVRLHLKIHIQNSHNLETALCSLTKLYQTW